MDLSKKFLYFNPDATAGQVDNAKTYPISMLEGIGISDATSVRFAFRIEGVVDVDIVDITVASGKGREVIETICEEINFSKQSVIVVADKSNDEKISNHIDLGTAPVITESAIDADSEFQVNAQNLSLSIGTNTTSLFSVGNSSSNATFKIQERGNFRDVAAVQQTSVAVPLTGTSTTGSREEGFTNRKQILTFGSGNNDNVLELAAMDSGSILYVTPTNNITIKLPQARFSPGMFFTVVVASQVNKDIVIQTNSTDGNDNIAVYNILNNTTQTNNCINHDAGAADHDELTITNAAAYTRIELINVESGTSEKWLATVISTNGTGASIA